MNHFLNFPDYFILFFTFNSPLVFSSPYFIKLVDLKRWLESIYCKLIIIIYLLLIMYIYIYIFYNGVLGLGPKID